MADKDLEDLRKLGQSAQDDDDLRTLRELGDERSDASLTWNMNRAVTSQAAAELTPAAGSLVPTERAAYDPLLQEAKARVVGERDAAQQRSANMKTYQGPQSPADLKSFRADTPSEIYTPQTPGVDRLTQEQGTTIDDFANSFAAERYFANWRNDSVIGNYLASPDNAEILRKEQRRRLALKQDQQGLLGEMGVSLTMRLGENVLRSPLPGAIDKLLPDIRRPLGSDFLSKEESDAEIKRRFAEKQDEVRKLENDFRSLQQRSREGEVIQPAADTATKMYATATGEDIQGLEQKLAKERRSLVNLKMMAEDDDAPLMKTWWRAGVENTAEAITRGMIDLTVKFPAIAAHYGEHGIGPKIIDDHLAPLVLPNDPAESPLYKWGLALDKMAHSMFPGDEVRRDDFIQKTFSGLGSMIPFMGTGMLAAKAGLGPLGVGLTASLTGGMQEAPQGFEKATEQMKLAKEAFEQNPAWKGFTPTERDRALLFAAYFAIGTTEGQPMANMFKTSGRGLKGRAQHALREGFEEGAQEGLQSVLEDLADWYYLRDPKAWFEDTAENAAVGAILGLSMGGLFGHQKRPISKLEKDVKAALKGADIDTFQNIRAYLDAELADDPIEVKQRFDAIFDEAWRAAGAEEKAKTESGTQPQQTMTDAEPEALVPGQQEAKLHAKPDVKTAPAPEVKPEEQKPEIAKPPVVEQAPAGDLFATPKTAPETVSKELQALLDAGFDEAQARKALAAIQPQAAKRSELQPESQNVPRETVKEGLTPEPVQVGQEQEITTPDGQMKVKARFEVVELADLEHASGDFQPRDRSRKESDVQTRALAFNLDPERLKPARTSDIGAPIASEDGTIMSGNGRVMAIRKIYQDPTLGFKEKEYRASLGPAAADMIAPVGIMRIAEPMTHADLVRFADLSNRIAIAGMSETERAMRDARAMGPEAMQLYTGGSFTSPANKEFFRLFMAKAVASSERGEVSKDGVLTQAGERRLRNAVLAAAYPDADLLAKMLESTDDNIRAISRAMLETASRFIRLKEAITRGEVKPEFDITKEIGAAARLISENRDKGVKPREFLAQQDAFNALDPITESLIRVFYNEELTRAVSAEKMIDALGWYADEAMKKKADDFFGDVTAPTDVLAKAKGKISETVEGQGDLLAGGEGTVRAGTQEGGPQAPGPANDAGGPAPDAGQQRIAALATERERDTRPAGERLLEHLRAGGSLSSRRAMAKELDLEPRVLNAEIGKALERGWLRRGPDGSLRRVPEAYQDGEQDLRLEMREASLAPEGLGIELNSAITELEDWLKERESSGRAQDNGSRVLEARQGQSARRGEEAPRGAPGTSLFALARQERGRGDRSVRSVEGRNYELPQPRADVRVYVSGSIGDEQGVKQRIYRLYTADKRATPDQDLKTLGRPAAFARIIERTPGRWEVLMTETDPAHRRRGFNRLLHNAIDADLGAPMAPSGTLTEDGYAFWKQRDPAALEHHRLYIPAGINGSEGALWLSPKGIAKLKAEFDDLAVMAAENGDMQAVQAYARENAELNRLLESIDWQKVDAPMLDMMFALSAYHGSPHRFDRFDISKIGTGEGNQAFGFGLYFAENEKTAQFYRDSLTPQVGDRMVFVNGKIGNQAEDIAFTHLIGAHLDGTLSKSPKERRQALDGAIRGATNQVDEYREANKRDPVRYPSQNLAAIENTLAVLKGWKESGADIEFREVEQSDLNNSNPGHLYEVTLKVEPDEILDQTAPVKDQGPAIQKVAADLRLTPNATGYSLYDTMVRRIALEHRGRISRGVAQQEASKRLLAAGIKGTKYKDSGSRNRDKPGTYNYVIFDDKVIDIQSRNGEKLPQQMPEPMLFSLAPQQQRPNGLVLKLPFLEKWGDPRFNPADRAKAVARLKDIAKIKTRDAAWSDLVAAKRDIDEIVAQLLYYSPEAANTKEDAYRHGNRHTYFYLRYLEERGLERAEDLAAYEEQSLLVPKNWKPELEDIQAAAGIALDHLISAKRKGLRDMMYFDEVEEPSRRSTGPKPDEIGAKQRSGFYFLAGRKLADVPDALFQQGGQAVINWLRQQGVRRAEIDHFGLQQRFGNNKPVTRQDFANAIADRVFDFRRKTSWWNPERPTGSYGGDIKTRAQDGPRIPGQGVYFERLMAFPKKFKGGETMAAGFFESPHWDNELKGTWASIRGTERELPGLGKTVVGEEMQTDFMQGVSFGRRPRLSATEFLAKKQEPEQVLRLRNQAYQILNEVRLPADSAQQYDLRPHTVLLDFGDDARWSESLKAARTAIEQRIKERGLDGEDVKSLDALDRADAFRKEHIEYLGPQGSEKLSGSDNFTPASPIDESYVRTMVRDLLLQAAQSRAQSVAISTAETTDRIQSNSHASAAHFYDKQLKPSLEKEIRRLSGKSDFALEKVALPKAMGAPRNQKPYTVWAAKLPAGVIDQVRSEGLPLFKLADGTPETTDAPDFGTPAYRASRPFTIGGETIVGYDKALADIRGVFEQHAGESGVRAERQAVLVLGPPGSGKSTVVGPITKSLGAAAISSDDPKFIIPEFRTWSAQGVHEEASLIAKMVQTELLADGTNVLIEKLGDNQNSIKGLLDILGSAGYQVRVVRVGAPKDELVKRIAKRAQRTGRDVPGWVLDQALTGIETTLQMVHGHAAVRGFVDVDNGGTTAKVVQGAEVINGLQDGIDRAAAERRQNKLRSVDGGAGSGVSNLPAAVQGGPRSASVRSEPAPADTAAPASDRQLRVVPGSGERAARSLDAAERYQEDGLNDEVRKAARLAPIEAAIADLGIKAPEEVNRLDPLIRHGFEVMPSDLEHRILQAVAAELAPIPGSVDVRAALGHQSIRNLHGVSIGSRLMVLTAGAVLANKTKPIILHEAVHIVRALRGFSEKEWASLTRYAEKSGVFDEKTESDQRTWRQLYEENAIYQTIRQQRGEDYYQDKLAEEAVAKLAEKYAEGERFAKRANTLLSRLVRFFKRIHNAILGHGYQTSEEFVDDILGRLQSGATAQRLDARTAAMEEARFMAALSPTERPRLGANPAMVAAMREKTARQPTPENAARRPFALTEKTAQKYGLVPGGVISFNFGHIIDKRSSKDEFVNPIFKDSATLRPAAARLLDSAPFAFKYESGTQYSLFMPLDGKTMLLAGVSFEPNEHGQYVGHTLFTLGRNQLAHKIGKAIEREAQKAEGPRAAQDRLVPNGQPPHLQAQGLQQSQSTSGSRQSHGRLIDTVFKGLTDADSIGAAMALVRRAKEINKAPALDVALRELAEAYTAIKIAETPFLAALSPKPPATSQAQRRNQLRAQIANLRTALTGSAGSSATGGAGRRGAIGRGGQPGQPAEAAGTEPAQRGGPDRLGGEGDVRPSLGGVAVSREDPDWLAQLKRLTFQSPEHKERARAQGFDVDRPMYHGTRVAGYQEIEEKKFDVGGLRGPGHYMTDEPRVAGGSDEQGFTMYGYTALNAMDYAGAPSPGVYKLVHRVENPFDTDTQMIMGDWLPPVYAKGWPKEGLSYDGAGQRIIKQQVTSWLNAPVETLKALVSNEAFKAPKTILRDALKKQGYDGITHEGGLITKGAKHRVVIAFDANQVRAINAEFDVFRKNQPVLLAALTKPLPGQPHRIAKPGAGTAAPEMGLSEIMRKVIRELGLTVRQGNLDKALKKASKAAGKDLQGQYNRDTGVIRQAVFNDIHVFAHEAGHAIEQRLGPGLKALLQSHFAEIRSFLSNTNTGPLLPTADVLSEGFSEFFRAFLTNPLAARSKATSFYPKFVDLLERRHPQMLASLEEAQMRIKEFYAASSAGVAQTIIADPKARRGIEKFTQEAVEMGFVDAVKLRLSNAYTYVFDRANPFWHATYRLLQVLEENTGKRIDLKVGENAYKLLRLMPHSAAWAQRDLLDGVRARDKARGSGPSLMGALKLALGNDARIALETGPGSRYRKFGAYLVARRAVHLWAQYQAGELEREPVAMTLGDAQEAIRALEKEFPDFQKAAQQVYEYQNNLLALMRDAGIISDDTFTDLTTNPKHKDYVPFLRSFEERGETAKTGGKTDVKKRAEVMKKLRGSQRDIIDPIASIAQKTYEIRQLIALNDVKMALIRLAETAGPGGGEIAERLDPNKGKMFEVSVRDALRDAAKDAGVDPHDTAQLIDMATTLMGEDATALMFQNGKLQAGRENIIWALEKGKPVPIRLSDGWIGKTMLESLAAFGPEHMNWLEKVLATPAHVLRGAIASHPSFMLRNIWIDGFMAAMYEPRALPWVTQIKGFVKAVREDADVKEYGHNAGLMGGAAVAGFEKLRLDRDVSALLKKGWKVWPWDSPGLFAGVAMAGVATGTVLSMPVAGAGLLAVGGAGLVAAKLRGHKVLRSIAETSEASETGVRTELYRIAKQRALAQGLNEAEAAQEAAFYAHDYLDYSNHGSKMGAWSRLVSFMNAAMQAQATYARWLTAQGDRGSAFRAYFEYLSGNGGPLSPREKRDLGRSAWAWFMTAAVFGTISAVIKAIWGDDDRLDEIPERLKATHWIVPINGIVHLIPKEYPGLREALDSKTKNVMLRAPKPFETAWVANFVERVHEGYAKNNPRWLEHYVGDLWETLHPPMEPQALSMYYELKTGKNFFTQQDILPRTQANRLREGQFHEYTSEFAKWLGKKTDTSPVYIDHAMNGLWSTWAKDATSLNVPGLPWYNPNKAEAGLDEMFIARRFLWNVGKGTESAKHVREAMGNEDPFESVWNRLTTDYSKLQSSANTFADYLKRRDHGSAMELLDRLTPRERGYAILDTFATGDAAKLKQVDPMKRAQTIAIEIGSLQKEIISDKILDKKAQGIKGLIKGKGDEEVPLGPSEKRVANDILRQITLAETHNALVVTGEYGYANRRLIDAGPLYRELELAVPKVHEELLKRQKKEHVLPFEGVKAVWPDVKKKLEDPDIQRQIRAQDYDGIRRLVAPEFANARGY